MIGCISKKNSFYAKVVKAPAPGAPTASTPQQAAKVQIQRISYIADSIGSNVKFDELEKIKKTKIKRRKAYGAGKASG
jgi:hypothetical protein